MVRVSITVEGSPEELTPVLQHLASLTTEKPVEQTESPNHSQVAEEVLTWTEEDIAAVWRDITFDCQSVLKEIAKRENSIPSESLADTLGITNNQLGGRLSSLGHQLSNHRLNRLPYPLPWTDNGYTMLPIWKNTIAKLEGE